MRNDCLFCAILDGDLPSFKLYEDEYFYVMLDRFPKCLGHTLILPKKHAANIFELSEEDAQKLIPLTQKVAAALQQVLNFDGLNLLQNNGAAAGQQVFHFHLHLIPRMEKDNMMIQYPHLDPSMEEFKEMADKIIQVMEK